MTIGIYALIFDNDSNNIYIGQSKNIEKRFQEHKYLLKLNKHTNKLLRAYTEYGLPQLKIVCICSINDLDIYENIFIKYFNSYVNGLNSLECSTDMPKPNNSGSSHGLSKYTDEQIINVFMLLIQQAPILKYTEIEQLTNVKYNTIANIASLSEHIWLKSIFPDEYTILTKLKGTRNIGREVNTAKIKGKKYPTVMSPLGTMYSDISNVAKFMREHRITSCRFYDLLNGKASKIMGWTTV